MVIVAAPTQPSATLTTSILGIAKRGLLKYLRTPNWWSWAPSRAPCSC